MQKNESAHEKIVAAILGYGKAQGFDEGHARQVTRLSLAIYDGLKELHGLGKRPRLLLECAGLLHDIGLTPDTKRAHHKRSMELILRATLPGLSEMERIMVALVARYHRKALPSVKHATYRLLDMRHRQMVSMLAACLRVADGLDRTHRAVVDDLSCEICATDIVMRVGVSAPAEDEVRYALSKGDLMQIVFGRWLAIRSLSSTASGA